MAFSLMTKFGMATIALTSIIGHGPVATLAVAPVVQENHNISTRSLSTCDFQAHCKLENRKRWQLVLFVPSGDTASISDAQNLIRDLMENFQEYLFAQFRKINQRLSICLSDEVIPIKSHLSSSHLSGLSHDGCFETIKSNVKSYLAFWYGMQPNKDLRVVYFTQNLAAQCHRKKFSKSTWGYGGPGFGAFVFLPIQKSFSNYVIKMIRHEVGHSLCLRHSDTRHQSECMEPEYYGPTCDFTPYDLWKMFYLDYFPQCAGTGHSWWTTAKEPHWLTKFYRC